MCIRDSPYSPDLALYDFHMFGPMKAKRRYFTDEVQIAMQEWVSDVGREFFNKGIEKFVSRYDKCLNKLGDFIEK